MDGQSTNICLQSLQTSLSTFNRSLDVNAGDIFKILQHQSIFHKSIQNWDSRGKIISHLQFFNPAPNPIQKSEFFPSSAPTFSFSLSPVLLRRRRRRRRLTIPGNRRDSDADAAIDDFRCFAPQTPRLFVGASTEATPPSKHARVPTPSRLSLRPY